MDPHEEVQPLGVPLMKPRGRADVMPAEDATTGHSESPALDQGRHPADELGLAKQLPSGMHAPTEQELAAIQTGQELEERRLYTQAIQANLGRFNSWGRWVDRTLFLAALAIVALLALFVFAQSVQILTVLAVQPLVVKVLGYGALIFLIAILAGFTGRLVILFLRLRVNQQISASQLKELSRRAELRALVQRDKAKAKKNLEIYLRSYPLDQRPTLEKLDVFRVDDDTIEKLRNERDYLLDQERFSDYDGWLKDFETRFQDVLQGDANKIVQNWMKLVGLKTAISPNPLVDSIVVLYCSYGMIGDLCRLYNVRMSRPGIMRLLTLSLFNTYAAGQIEDHLGSLSDSASSLAQRVDLQPFLDAANSFTFGISGFVGKLVLPKVADGAANALLLRKLGHITIALLRPIDPR